MCGLEHWVREAETGERMRVRQRSDVSTLDSHMLAPGLVPTSLLVVLSIDRICFRNSWSTFISCCFVLFCFVCFFVCFYFVNENNIESDIGAIQGVVYFSANGTNFL